MSEPTVKHVVIYRKGDRVQADCEVCGMGVDAPMMMGGIPGVNLLDAFATLHEHKETTQP